MKLRSLADAMPTPTTTGSKHAFTYASSKWRELNVLISERNRLLVQSWNKWREVYADRFDSMGGSCRCRCIASTAAAAAALLPLPLPLHYLCAWPGSKA